MNFKNLLFFLFLAFHSLSSSADEITAKSWIVADLHGNTLLEENSTKVLSIASITKLMTVLVILDQNPNLYSELVIKQDKHVRGKIPAKVKKLSLKELISLSLVSSDNLAALNICYSYNNKNQKKAKYPCVAAMNAKAKSLGMHDTVFVEPTGLSAKNVSTAQDLAKLVRAAAEYSEVNENANKRIVTISSKKRFYSFKNTNPLAGHNYDIVVSKTGWTFAAGGCIAMLINDPYQPKIIVLLGSKSTRTRIPEAETLYALPPHEIKNNNDNDG